MQKIAIFLVALLSLQGTIVFAYVSPGVSSGYVNDFANVLSPEVKKNLEAQLVAFAEKTTTEIAVVTVPTIGDDYIEHYTEQLFKEWGIGTKNDDNGILLLVSVNDRKLRIEVGYGLEGAVPDGVADSIIRNDIVPELKSGNYDVAVSHGVDALMQASKDEYVAKEQAEPVSNNDIFQVLFFFGIFGLQWLAAILGKTKEWWLGGVLGFVGGSTLAFFNPFGFSLFAYGTIIAGLTAFGAFFDYIVSSTFNHAQSHGYDSPWWIGGGSGGSSFGGGGFGGFSGGSSGGGGASGSW